ncbi:hypothetical protein [Peribacillus asahii]|uniref:hypothetical protein n=1 Tax=Peribacillus asahii TaxID=228899 RepID=UPI0037FEF732
MSKWESIHTLHNAQVMKGQPPNPVVLGNGVKILEDVGVGVIIGVKPEEPIDSFINRNKK